MHQRIRSRRRKGSILGVVTLAHDQQVVAPVYRPHPVGIQIRQLSAGRLHTPAGINKLNWSVTGENERRCSRTEPQPPAPRHTRRSTPPDRPLHWRHVYCCGLKMSRFKSGQWELFGDIISAEVGG